MYRMINKNAVVKAEGMRGKVNPKFSISYSQILEIYDYYEKPYAAGLALFRLGYMQGMKAALSEEERIDKV